VGKKKGASREVETLPPPAPRRGSPRYAGRPRRVRRAQPRRRRRRAVRPTRQPYTLPSINFLPFTSTCRIHHVTHNIQRIINKVVTIGA